jgi:hypothetical protein
VKQEAQMLEDNPLKTKPKFSGPIKKGEVRNPKGNPNPLIGKYIQSGGPKKDISKLRALVCSGMLKKTSNSRILNKFKVCDKCPLKPKTEEVFHKGEFIEVRVPAKCPHYNEGGKCVIPQDNLVRQLRTYFKIGEKFDSMMVQEALAYAMIENAEISKETEMLLNRRPGFYTARFQELASKNLADLNRMKFGEKVNQTNVNIDLSDAIIQAYSRRKSEKTEAGDKDGEQGV